MEQRDLDMLFDRRVVERNIQRGLLTRGDLAAWLGIDVAELGGDPDARITLDEYHAALEHLDDMADLAEESTVRFVRHVPDEPAPA